MRKKYLSNLRPSSPLGLSILGMGMLFCFSCEGLLDEKPKLVTEENFYNTAQEVATAVNAIYSPLRTENQTTYIATLECHTDYGYGRGSFAQYNDFQGMNSNNINRVAGFWNAFYLSIRNANIVIKNAPDGESISQEDVDRYVAEAKFLRALSYFHLVRNWGAIPLRTEHNMEELALAKSSSEEVYELILNDLWAAETYLPEQQELSGRPTQAAAKTLLADVYLQLEQFAEAREKAQEVIESGIFSLVTVTSRDDFQKIFGPDVISNPEEIFSLKFARQLGQGNYLPWVYNHPNTGLYSFGGSYAIYSDASDTFHKSWDDGDLRKGLWDMVDFGLGDSTLVSRKFIDPQAIGNNDAGNDLPIYRYPEVLLIFAEAAARDAGAPTEESLEALNQVRRRAYGQDPSVPSEVDYLLTDYDLTSFVDLVIQEKAYEFQFEGKRWLDLKRTGKAEEMIRKNKGLSIAESHYLWPIPYSELDYNPALDPSNDQNPGY
ncbi:MAG TPA: RagB/SusD family nutrient uptake outer membrane protein [Cyclobacteriaceae bacterium]|nr:RagB/SusD family nutrient uptake outer membrane protein [Cyclobacteriaceae bacterium]